MPYADTGWKCIWRPFDCTRNVLLALWQLLAMLMSCGYTSGRAQIKWKPAGHISHHVFMSLLLARRRQNICEKKLQPTRKQGDYWASGQAFLRMSVSTICWGFFKSYSKTKKVPKKFQKSKEISEVLLILTHAGGTVSLTGTTAMKKSPQIYKISEAVDAAWIIGKIAPLIRLHQLLFNLIENVQKLLEQWAENSIAYNLLLATKLDSIVDSPCFNVLWLNYYSQRWQLTFVETKDLLTRSTNASFNWKKTLLTYVPTCVQYASEF
jgi:hypothetical protein